jgi:hypothetical protein
VDVAAIVMRGRDTRKRRGGDGKEKPMPSLETKRKRGGSGHCAARDTRNGGEAIGRRNRCLRGYFAC